MFIEKDEIKRKINDIILDDYDNDIIFIVAQRGFGKLKLLKDLFTDNSKNKDIIIINERSNKSISQIKSSFISAITDFIVQNPSKRRTFFDLLSTYNDNTYKIWDKIHIKRNRLIAILQHFEIAELKEIYVNISDNTPLVILINAIVLQNTDGSSASVSTLKWAYT